MLACFSQMCFRDRDRDWCLRLSIWWVFMVGATWGFTTPNKTTVLRTLHWVLDSVSFTKIAWLFPPLIRPNMLKSIYITVELVFIHLFRFLFLVWKHDPLSLKLAEACSILTKWISEKTKQRGSWDITLARFALGKNSHRFLEGGRL